MPGETVEGEVVLKKPRSNAFAGKRPGRGKGKRNKSTVLRELYAFAPTQRPITPLEVFNESMQEAWDLYKNLRAPHGTMHEDPGKQRAAEVALSKAGYWAEKLAPYIHPKPVASKEDPSRHVDPTKLSDSELLALIQQETAPGGVVDAEAEEE